MMICMAAPLNEELDKEKHLTTTKLFNKLYDWMAHACRRDDEAFN